MTILVQQKPDKKDCFLACICMAAEITYEYALQLWSGPLVDEIHKGGLYGQAKIDEAFKQIGMIRDKDYKVFLGVCENVPVEFQCSAPRMLGLLWGRKAIVQLPSLNFENGSHMVFWDGEKVYDPSLLKTYETLEGTAPEYVWLITNRANPGADFRGG